MDEYSQGLSYSLSLQQLLEELENFIVLETQRNGRYWVGADRLINLFYEKYKVSPEEVLKAQRHSDGLKSFLKCSRRFLIYGTSIYQEFYVALAQEKVTEEIPKCQHPELPKYQPKLASEIRTSTDLKVALTEITKSLIIHNPKKSVTIAVLSKKFFDHYKQPIRVVVRNVCPEMKLSELLQTIPDLHIQRKDDSWQISIEFHGME